MPTVTVSRGVRLFQALVLALVCWQPFSGSAWAAGRAPGDDDKGKPTPYYFGASQCAECHDKEQPKENKEFPPLCRCTEMRIWREHDKHKEAYNVLLKPRAQEMGKLLKVDVTKPESGCLACHGVVVPKGAEVEKTSFKLTDGVSCVVCHGANEEWVNAHTAVSRRKQTEWRALSRNEKHTKYGMTDLWDPIQRTELCTSCHVGNTGAGKVVTHAMYAAGHPPLPGFEVGTFSEEIPRHWEYPREKSPEVQKLLNFKPEQARFEQSKLVLIGGIIAFRDSLTLLASQAEACEKASDAEHRSLDLAQFDCYACHHELRTQSWRQTRGYVGKPGRLTMRPWPTALVTVALRHLGRDEKELDGHLRKLADAFAERPFGNTARITPEARAIAQWADKLAKDLVDRPVDEQSARRLLDLLSTFRDNEYPDFDAARQRAWAFLLVFGELKKGPYEDARKNARPLVEMLDLQLPSRQDRQILTDLPVRLARMSEYDPVAFKHTFRETAERMLKETE